MLPQGELQFWFAIRVGCVDVWPILSISKMKAFCIYLYQGNVTFKNIIVSFIINLVEYLVINSYSVTVLDNFRKGTSDRPKKYLFLEVFNNLTFILVHHLRRRFDEGITLTVWITTFCFFTSLQVRELCSCFAAAWCSLLQCTLNPCHSESAVGSPGQPKDSDKKRFVGQNPLPAIGFHC